MIAPDHAAVALLFSHRANKKIIRNRNLRSSKTSVQIGQMLASENVAAFDANNFALTNWFDGEQTLALDRTRPYSRFVRQIRQLRHQQTAVSPGYVVQSDQYDCHRDP